ncbi:putative polysaccharide biosynthesis protein [Candidatus Soleaferrea massiliensis]|uniref:putative polysaccharide biosynthesis protein n=1 Tax=Candidatus Soleaferrea massiliensis TaxID=1470354 RepID=UPI0005905BE1|nr:polysaccharide biosynthesis protein [Candidatus Soleaferrea massiliensis]
MSKRTGQSFLHGALILVAATIVVKLIGALFKIPLTNLIGGTGMGYFMTAYTLFNPIYALSIAGLPVAVSKLVAEHAARRQYRDVRRIMKLSCTLFFILGLGGFLLLFFGAPLFAKLVGNQDALLSILMISPAVFFGCMMSSYRGYYEGLRNMYPTAVSQIVEAVAKLGFGIFGAAYLMQLGMQQYETTGLVFGTLVNSLDDAKAHILPFAAAGAIAGVALSTMMGALFLILRHRLKGDGITKEQMAASPPAQRRRVLMRSIVKIALPACLGAVVINITSLIDVVTIMNRLQSAIQEAPDVILSMYRAFLPEGMNLSEIPNYLYGSYNGTAVTIFNLVPAITVSFGISALPAVASAWGLRNKKQIQHSIQSVLRITTLIAIPAGVGLSVLAQPILELLYSARPDECMIAAPLLQMMGIGAIFVAITTPVNSILQAVGRAGIPVKLMILGASLKLATNLVLISIPSVNIKGAPIGTILCYVLIVLLSLWILKRSTNVSLNVSGVFLKPGFAAAIMGVTAFVSHDILARIIDGKLATLCAIALSGIIYIFVLFLIRGIVKDDVIMLPKGEKIAKALEKYKLIG